MENKKSKRVPARDRVRERSREDRDKQRHTHTYSSTLRVQEQQLSQSALTSHGRVLVFYPPPFGAQDARAHELAWARARGRRKCTEECFPQSYLYHSEAFKDKDSENTH